MAAMNFSRSVVLALVVGEPGLPVALQPLESGS